MSDHGPDRTIARLPHALDAPALWQARLGGHDPALFLDYDGVLTPILDDPTRATLPADVRDALEAAADRMPVAVISGRDLDDVRTMVAIDGLAYAGSHGFDMVLPDGTRDRRGDEHVEALDAVERQLVETLRDVDGATVQRKRYAIAVHTRGATEDIVTLTDDVVDAAVADRSDLTVTAGRDVREVRPDIPWDKGRALRHFVEVLDLDPARRPPVYMGDDVTDEDAFAVIVDDGIGVVVAGAQDRPTAAHVRLEGPHQTAELLAMLVDRALHG